MQIKNFNFVFAFLFHYKLTNYTVYHCKETATILMNDNNNVWSASRAFFIITPNELNVIKMTYNLRERVSALEQQAKKNERKVEKERKDHIVPAENIKKL